MENSYEAVNGNGFIGTNGHFSPRHHSPRLSWLDLRVFYVRISKCEIDESTPEQLTLNHIPLDPNTLLEVNGVRASIYSDGVSTILRRDRLDRKFEEATFVSTDSIRVTGSVKFEVFDGDVLVLSGSLDKCDSNGFLDGEESDHVSRMWSMRCETNVTAGTGFLKGKQLRGSELASPAIEVFVAGSFLGTPIMLTKSLNLNPRRKQVRMAMLNSIPEHDTAGSDRESSSRLALQVPESPDYKPENEVYSNFYPPGSDHWEGEDGELTWFNAGVRVGVGIGLSVCLGIGIGVGLLAKTYQGTTRTFRRRFF